MDLAKSATAAVSNVSSDTEESKDSIRDDDYPKPAIAWSSVGVLSVAYMFSLMDRSILVLLVEPIKADLQISDTQVSLLTGFAFALVYTVMGIPMGRVADLWVRKYVILFGVTVWSLLTLLSGFARSFGQLFLARMGVGFGEAGLTAPALSMISDLFPPKRLAFPLSVFMLGGYIGGSLSLVLGGAIIGFSESVGSVNLPIVGEILPWRFVLMVAGLISLSIIIPLMFLSEPKRHHKNNKNESVNSRHIDFNEVLAYLWQHKKFYGVFLFAASCNYIIAYGSASWIPTYFIRLHGWDASSIGMTLGLVSLLPIIIGSLFSGRFIDYLYCQGYRSAPIWVMSVAGPMQLIALLTMVYAPLIEIKICAIFFTYLFGAMYVPMEPLTIQMATPNAIRAQVSSIMLFVLNLVGIGLGPLSIALVTDYIFKDDMAVGDSMAVISLFAYLLSAIAFYFCINPYRDRLMDVLGPKID